MQARQLMSMLTVSGLAALLASGCSADSTSGGLATIRLSVGRADATAGTAVSLATQDVATAGAVDLSNVSAIDVDLDSVQVQATGSDGWQTAIPSGAPLALNLVTDLGTAIDVGTVTIPTGPCEARLFVSNAMITFANDIVFGQHTVAAGDYLVTIPSGSQTGLKADGNCDAADGDHVTLGFDVGATVGTIVATGNGTILLTPVIHVVQP